MINYLFIPLFLFNYRVVISYAAAVVAAAVAVAVVFVLCVDACKLSVVDDTPKDVRCRRQQNISQ